MTIPEDDRARWLAETWNACQPRLRLIAKAFVDASSADDAIQDAFIALAVQNPRPEDAMGWLVRVVRNRVISEIRSRTRRSQREESVAESERDTQDPTVIAERTIDGALAIHRLQQLPENLREVIVLHLWGHMSFAQIADVSQTSKSSVHRMYHDGLERLRQQFTPESNSESLVEDSTRLETH